MIFIGRVVNIVFHKFPILISIIYIIVPLNPPKSIQE
jgi:hypothetical protein